MSNTESVLADLHALRQRLATAVGSTTGHRHSPRSSKIQNTRKTSPLKTFPQMALPTTNPHPSVQSAPPRSSRSDRFISPEIPLRSSMLEPRAHHTMQHFAQLKTVASEDTNDRLLSCEKSFSELVKHSDLQTITLSQTRVALDMSMAESAELRAELNEAKNKLRKYDMEASRHQGASVQHQATISSLESRIRRQAQGHREETSVLHQRIVEIEGQLEAERAQREMASQEARARIEEEEARLSKLRDRYEEELKREKENALAAVEKAIEAHHLQQDELDQQHEESVNSHENAIQMMTQQHREALDHERLKVEEMEEKVSAILEQEKLMREGLLEQITSLSAELEAKEESHNAALDELQKCHGEDMTEVSNSHKDALQQAAGKIDSLARAMDEDRRSFDQQAAELVKESTEELTGKIEELENELKSKNHETLESSGKMSLELDFLREQSSLQENIIKDLKEQLSAAAEHIYKVTVEKDEAIHQRAAMKLDLTNATALLNQAKMDYREEQQEVFRVKKQAQSLQNALETQSKDTVQFQSDIQKLEEQVEAKVASITNKDTLAIQLREEDIKAKEAEIQRLQKQLDTQEPATMQQTMPPQSLAQPFPHMPGFYQNPLPTYPNASFPYAYNSFPQFNPQQPMFGQSYGSHPNTPGAAQPQPPREEVTQLSERLSQHRQQLDKLRSSRGSRFSTPVKA